jgi:muramoyltetrapeptide carboxypeptidase
MKRKYQTLKKGDVVDVIAPAYGIKPQEVERIKEYIKSLGLVPRVPKDLLAGDIIKSAPTEVRFRHLKDALTNDISKAVWAIKGGSGSPELIPLLAKIKKPKKQKLFIAFSDTTSIHFFLNQSWGWQTVHGPILWQIVRNRIDKETIKQVENVIFGREYKRDFKLSQIMNGVKAKNLKVDAVIGGNLKLVQCSIGTIWQIQPKNKILLFEDINEKPYQLDRILTHIIQAKLLDGAAAIVFGDFEGGEEPMDMPKIEMVLERFAKQVKIPVYRTSGIGHTSRNYAVHFGVPGEIKGNKLVLAKV